MSFYEETGTGFNCLFFYLAEYDSDPSQSTVIYDCTDVSEEQIIQDVYNSNLELQVANVQLATN